MLNKMLSQSIDTLKGIGKSKMKTFSEHNITTLRDLILYLPKSYEDRRNPTAIRNINSEGSYFVVGRVLNKNFKSNWKKSILNFDVIDSSGAMIHVTFFNAFYINNLIKEGKVYSFYGQISYNLGWLQMIHPEFCEAESESDIRGIVPVYSNIGSISGRQIRNFIKQINDIAPLENIEEWIPESILNTANVCSISYALKGIHFPKTKSQILEGRYRLIFGELLTLETGLLLIKGRSRGDKFGPVITGERMWDYIDKLPFELTEDQKKAASDISSDLSSSRPMNRLIQGDVGSGKTVLAESSMYAVAKAGYQSAFMAPTEILAKQHYNTISKTFNKYGLKCGLLVSNQSQKLKKSVLNDLKSGKIDVVIGTHAVISDNVKFNKLGLVITDEQHRFGVNQRRMLSEKSTNPNVMVMTATPIPRTIAVVVFGDLDISIIKTMPKGRKKIITRVCSDSSNSKISRDNVYENLREEIRKGRQGYVIAPLIDESDVIDANSATKLFEEMQLKFPDIKIALLHGEMNAETKEKIMEDFYNNKISLLVSTVVIEVGINVPNATVMVIENTERFGLAQLHQLRGRVGRGGDQSYCYLILNSKSETAITRAEIMESTSDGFIIAEEDLKLRGPGDILGKRQHGLPDLKFAHLTKHIDVLQKTLQIANEILVDDPKLTKEKNQMLKSRIKELYGDNLNLTL